MGALGRDWKSGIG